MDKITIEITETGIFKVDTDGVSAPNHSNAEGFIRKMAELAGGTTKRVLKPQASLHAAFHAHTADGHTHATGGH